MNTSSRVFFVCLALAVSAGVDAQDNGNAILSFRSGDSQTRWVAKRAEYATNQYYERVESPAAPKLVARVEKAPADSRSYYGQSVLRIVGTLDSDSDTVVFESPFAAPAKEAKAASASDRGHPELGFFYRAGLIELTSLTIKSAGAPVEVSLELENDRGGVYYVSFPIEASPIGWRLMKYSDAQYSYIAASGDRPKIEYGWLRLASITVSSIGMRQKKEATLALRDGMTDAQKSEYFGSRPPAPYLEETADISIQSVSVKQEFSWSE